MTTLTAINKVNFDHSNLTPMQRSLRRWNAGLFVSTFFGIVSGLGGLTIGFLTIVELIVPSTSLYTGGTVLIGASFILFGVAAHCLDKADVADKEIRREYCLRHGLQLDDIPADEDLRRAKSSLLLKGALLFKEGVIVTNVPYHLKN